MRSKLVTYEISEKCAEILALNVLGVRRAFQRHLGSKMIGQLESRCQTMRARDLARNRPMWPGGDRAVRQRRPVTRRRF